MNNEINTKIINKLKSIETSSLEIKEFIKEILDFERDYFNDEASGRYTKKYKELTTHYAEKIKINGDKK